MWLKVDSKNLLGVYYKNENVGEIFVEPVEEVTRFYKKKPWGWSVDQKIYYWSTANIFSHFRRILK